MQKWTEIINGMKSDVEKLRNGKDFYKGSNSLLVDGLLEKASMLKDWYSTNPQGDDRYKHILNMPKISLDLDDVVFRWVDAWREYWSIKDVPTTWYFDSKILERFEQMRSIGELDKFYENLKLLENPLEIPFEPECYITSRPVTSEVSARALEKNGFPQRPVFTTTEEKTKVDIAKERGIDIHIDDNFDNFVKLNNAGVLCYLYDRPHNHRYDVGHLRIKRIKEVLDRQL